MKLTELHLESIVTFQKLDLTFSPGINVIFGENGVGKTHILKILYAACRTADGKTSFPYKLMRVFQPTDMEINRVIRRQSRHIKHGEIKVVSESAVLSCKIDRGAKEYRSVRVYGTGSWCSQTDYRSLFIPEKDVLQFARQLEITASKKYFEIDDTQIDMLAAINTESKEGEKNLCYEFPDAIAQLEPEYIQVQKKQRYYLRTPNKYELTMSSPTMKKIAVLKTLGMNGSLLDVNILFWDAPDADMDAGNIPGIADLIFDLCRKGKQIFLTTNNCVFARYLEALANNEDMITYHSIRREELKQRIACDSGPKISELPENPLEKKFSGLMKVISEQTNNKTPIAKETSEKAETKAARAKKTSPKQR